MVTQQVVAPPARTGSLFFVPTVDFLDDVPPGPESGQKGWR